MPNSSRTNRVRLFILYFITMLLLVVCVARLVQLMVFNAEDIQGKVENQWTKDISDAPVRGNILDVNGEILATSATTTSVLLYPKQIKDPGEIADKLAPILSMDRQKVFEVASDKTKVEAWLKRNISDEQVEKIRDLQLKGIGFFSDLKRIYPYGSFLSQVLGYADSDGIGQQGIEKTMNEYLNGESGTTIAQVDAQGRVVSGTEELYIEVINGYDVVLTVNTVVQTFAENSAKAACDKYQADSVGIIVMNPKTFKIAAMAGYPQMNINEYSSYSSSDITKLIRNRNVSDPFQPGTMIDGMVLAAAMDLSVGGTYECSEDILINDEVVRCWSKHHHGKQSVSELLENSCNVGLSKLALDLNKDNLYSYLFKFGFGSKTSAIFNNESKGYLKEIRYARDIDVAKAAEGQDMTVTPIQLITAYSALVNGGKYGSPIIVDHLEDDKGNKVYPEQEAPKQIISDSTALRMKQLLINNVKEGNSKNARINGITVGGNTATAKNIIDGQTQIVCSSVAFAPADDPEFIVLTVVRNPKSYMAYGELAAAYYSGEVLEKCLKFDGYNLAPVTGEGFVEIPDITDHTSDAGKWMVEQAGLKFELKGKGDIVGQSPKAGTYVEKGTVVTGFASDYTEISDTVVIVPDLKGKTLYQAFEELRKLSLNIAVQGENQTNVISSQEPAKGTELHFGDTVTVTCD